MRRSVSPIERPTGVGYGYPRQRITSLTWIRAPGADRRNGLIGIGRSFTSIQVDRFRTGGLYRAPQAGQPFL
jgi:hypothetical protein